MTCRDASVSIMGSIAESNAMPVPRPSAAIVPRTDITVASERYIVTPSHEKRAGTRGTAGNEFSHPRQVACRLQRNRCADGERHAKARLMNTGKGGKLWRSSRP